MEILNVEIKAKCENSKLIKSILKEKNALFKGKDHQIDTYFNSGDGRLKLRQGNIENSLIFYKRDNMAGPKDSFVRLARLEETEDLLEVLTASNGVKVVVDKVREIYFIGNVKFHIDNVKGLGSFVEIEAIDKTGDIGRDRLLEQCEEYLSLFKITNQDLLSHSYSDMLL
ncbi:class IV adenylate cyclase [Bacteriovoracaceae bacterium]|nr:class IV adenylate cyclase [Bacteriovoracaceae bacterium]